MMLDANTEKMRAKLAEIERNLNESRKGDTKLNLENQEMLGEVIKNQNLYSVMILAKGNIQVGSKKIEMLELRTMGLVKVKDRLLYAYTVREFKSKDDVEILKNFTIQWLNQIIAANQK
jgi:hypothetical protein